MTNNSISYVSLEKFIKELGMKPPEKARGGSFFRILGAILILVTSISVFVILIIIAVNFNNFEEATLVNLIIFIGSTSVLFISYRIFVKGRKKEQILRIYKDLTDTRKPIVYLRSFSDDDKGLNIKKLLRMFVPLYFNKVFYPPEEALSRALKRIGPVIAIGQPGESLPGLGSMKVYTETTGNKWQSDLNQILKVCSTVVLRAGFTNGLEWEFKKVFEVIEAENIWIYVDMSKRKYPVFRQKFQEWTRIDLPEANSLSTMKFFIYFDKNFSYTISPIETPFFRQRLYQPNTSPFIYGLKPLFERSSTTWNKPSRNVMLCFFAGLLILCIALFIFARIYHFLYYGYF